MTERVWHLRPAAARDAGRLAEFAARTFTEAFGADNDPEDLKQHLEASFGARQQLQEIEDADVRTLVAATDSGRLLAYAQVRRSRAPACVEHPRPVELLRFYVDQTAHGSGLAQELMDGVHIAASDLGGAHLWLSVWERNPRALRFYAKVAFEDVGSADFWVGSDRQTDRILVAPVCLSSTSLVSA